MVVQAQGLTKTFKGEKAVDGLDLVVPEGSVFGLIGPNGAGKTTTLHMLLGLLRPDRGNCSVFGEDSLRLSWPTRQRIGYLSEADFTYDDMPVDDLLKFVASFYPQWDWDLCRSLIAELDVPTTKPLKELSKGVRRRAELLVTLAPRPDLLVLDDPAIGLDATIRRKFLWGALSVARDEGRTVLFTSHVLQDVERVVDTIGILIAGRIVAVAPLDELKARTKRIIVGQGRGTAQLPVETPGELSREVRNGHQFVVTSAFDPEFVTELRKSWEFVRVEDLGLEDIFLAYVANGGNGGKQ